MTYLPEQTLRLMSAADRAKLGKAGVTMREASAKYISREEKRLQQEMQGWLTIKGIVVGRQRMDKKSNMPLGWPDLVFCIKGEAFAIEVKLSGRMPEPDQEHMLRRMKENGWRVGVVHSLDELREIVVPFLK